MDQALRAVAALPATAPVGSCPNCSSIRTDVIRTDRAGRTDMICPGCHYCWRVDAWEAWWRHEMAAASRVAPWWLEA